MKGLVVFEWPATVKEARDLPREEKRHYWKAQKTLVNYVGKTRAERRNAWRDAWQQLRKENRAAKQQTRKQIRKASMKAAKAAA